MKQFIELTDIDNDKYLININSIAAVYPDKDCTIVVFTNSESMVGPRLNVKEAYEDVKRFISESL